MSKKNLSPSLRCKELRGGQRHWRRGWHVPGFFHQIVQVHFGRSHRPRMKTVGGGVEGVRKAHGRASEGQDDPRHVECLQGAVLGERKESVFVGKKG